MLCDGRMVCGCADPYGKRVLGDARTATVAGIWTGETASRLRQDLNGGGSKFCGDCPLKLPLKRDQAPPQRDLKVGPLPSRLYVECTAACNISCNQACCAPETGITRTRQAGMLDFDLFTRVIDEAGPSLGRVDFFNYGEAFLHKRAVEMCEYIKTRFPHIYLYTSTNGLALTEERARRLVHSGIDEVTFSIDGATPETYVQYRQRGDFNKAIANLTAAVDEKRKNGRDVPFINWRYILFNWNDSDEEMALARRLATEIGVDRLSWEITDHPENAYSRRFVPGTPALRGHQIRGVGRQRPRERDPRSDAPCRHRRAHADPGAAARGPPGPRHAGSHPCAEPLRARLPSAGELRAPSRATRRSALHRRRHPHRARLRAGLAAAQRRGRGRGRRAHRNPRARGAGTLQRQVRPGE